jgi:phosphate transport system substrate-binding protein
MKTSRKKSISIVLGMLLAAAMVAGCGSESPAPAPGDTGGEAKAPDAVEPPQKTVIQNCGSDTMLQVAGKWSSEYGKLNPNVSVEVTGGGSGVGISNLEKGLTTIANASRDIKPAEAAQAKANTGKDPVQHVVGYDGIGIYVHVDNPITEIAMEDLAAIYIENPTITKWSQLGITLAGNDDIVVVSRQNSSGTYEYFREHVLDKKDFRLGMQSMSGSKDVVDLVTKTPGAIGYSGMGYKTDAVKFVAIAPKKGDPAVTPSIQAVADKSYPLARSLNMYTLGEAEGEVKKYLDWIAGPEGQKIIEEEGYIPITAVQSAH